ncbi:MAG: tRNA uridine-5-carboxymethylaminomethyl(34) synthesis GTPase MnmE [Microvirga sp.]
MRSDDTIFAIASGQGRAALSVVRISGPGCRAVLHTLAGGIPEARRLTLRTLTGPDGTPLDQALVAWMPGPASFTGEDQAELHIHGGLASRAAILGSLARLAGLRPAEPGEFTRRAFLHGRMDLTQVEGLADLIDAETESQRRQALQQLDGHLGRTAERWREDGIAILASLEATLDFADEGDVPPGLAGEATDRLGAWAAGIDAVLANSSGERLREGLTIVIVGSPNAGKSTLLNAIARRDVAIVSPIAGTTRDAIEVRCDLGGVAATIVDTAGLRDSLDPIEREGVSRARMRARDADLVLWLRAPGDADEGPSDADRVITIASKMDLLRDREGCDLAVSATTGEGMAGLMERLRVEAGRLAGHRADAVITRERHRSALDRASRSFRRAHAMAASGTMLELVAEDVRLGVRALGEVTGRVDVDTVLDRIFSDFCIGK